MNELKIAVAGTGYVGLSIATLLSQHHKVTAVDVVQEKVDKILDCGIITKEVSVPEIHGWLKQRRQTDPGCFIASLR